MIRELSGTVYPSNVRETAPGKNVGCWRQEDRLRLGLSGEVEVKVKVGGGQKANGWR
jgi:hypothetical protein